jgi:hypothetical protein
MVGSTGTVITMYRCLADMPPDALGLFRDSVGTEAPGGLAWHRLLAQDAMGLGQGTRFYVVSAASPEATPLVVLPMRIMAPGGWSPRPRGPQTIATMWTTDCHPIIADTVDDPVPLLRDLMVHIANEPGCESLKLEPVAREEPIFGQLVAALRAAGLVIHPFFLFHNWYLVVAGRSADEILEGLPPRLVNTIHRKSRSLDASARSRVSLFTGPEDIETAIADCERVYRMGWQSEGRYQGFDPGLMRACANHGWLRLGVLYVDELPAAAQCWIVVGSYALIFSLAYDEQYAKLSPGTVLMAHMLRHVIDEDRVEVVDFLQGDDPYKQDWMSHRRERWGVLAMNPRTARGLLGIARHRGGRAAKRLVLLPFRALRYLARRLRP